MPHQCTNCGRTFPDGSREMLSGCPDCGGNKFQFQPSSADGKLRDDPADQGDGAPNTAEPTAGGSSGSAGSIVDAVSDATDRVRDWVDGDGREWPDESSDPAPNEDAAQADARTGVVSPNELPDPPADARLDTTPDASSDEAIDASPDTPPETPEAVDGSDGTSSDSQKPVASSETAVDVDIETPPDATSPNASDTPDTSTPNASDTSTRPDTTAEDERPDSDDDDSELAPGSDPDLAELRAELNEQFESIKIVSPGQYELNLMELYDRDEYIISLMEDGRYAIEVPEAWRDEG